MRPDSRIVYVDKDPAVLSHARAFLVGRDPGATDYLDADLRDPEFILREAAKTLNFTREMSLQQYTARSQAEIARFSDRLDLVEPGLVPMQDWRSGPEDPAAENLIPWVCGVARKP